MADTDNETSANDVRSPRRCRSHAGTDAGSLDVVGFDAAVPTLIADFSRGL